MRSSLSLTAAITVILGVVSVARAETIYVSNERDNTISIVDGNNLRLVKSVPVGQRPRGIILSPDHKLLYICTSDDDHIEVLDLASQKVVRTLPSGPDPELMILDREGKLLYVANEDNNMVTVVDVQAGRMITEIAVGVEPEGMGLSPDGKTLVTTSETTNMVHFIDTGTLKNFANVLVDSRPRFAEFTKDGKHVWVSAEIGGTLTIIDTATQQIVKKIGFQIPGVRAEAIQPVGVRLTRDGKLAFAALGPANRVAVIDAQTHQVKTYLLVGQRVWQLAFNADETRLYTTNGVSNDISVIDVAALKVIKSISVGGLPWGVAVAP